MIAALVTLATEAAVAGVIAGMLLAWGLAGGDGVGAHPIAALLGLLLFVGTIATTGAVIGLFHSWTGAAVLVTALSAVAAATLWMARQPPDRDRRPLYGALVGLALLLPVVVGFLGTADAAAARHLLIAAVAPAALVLALVPPWGDTATRRDPTLLPALLVLAAPLGLLAATLLA